MYFFFLDSEMLVRLIIMVVYFKAQTHKYGQLPESGAKAVGDGSIFIAAWPPEKQTLL